MDTNTVAAADTDIRELVDQLDDARHDALAARDYARADRLSREADALLTGKADPDTNHDGLGNLVPVPMPGLFHGSMNPRD